MGDEIVYGQKMQIEFASTMGFCAGVRRAVSLLEEALATDSDASIATFGPLIHNPGLVADFCVRGVRIVDDPEQVEEGERIVIRAHGVPEGIRRRLAERGARIIDATCGRVLRNIRAAREAEAEGRTVVLAGDAGHGEMLAVAGSLHHPQEVRIIGSVAEADKLEAGLPVTLIAQTTFDAELFARITAAASRATGDCRAAESICPATRTRQEAVASLAERVDAVLVVGGANSANTRRLYEIAAAGGRPAWRVEGPGEIPEEITRFSRVGISAGASTPDSVIEAVAARVRRLAGGD